MASPKLDKAVLQRRQTELQTWFTGLLSDLGETATQPRIVPLSGDASFRRYFTVRPGDTTYVLVDAPPDKEDCHAFVQIAEKFEAAGVNVPHVHGVDYAKGFMCLSFLGDTLLNTRLQELKKQEHFAEVHDIYNHAFDILTRIQSIREGSDILLPPYDGGLLMRELELFREWFCGGIMELSLSKAEEGLLDHYFGVLIDAAQAQPQVCVHRDYHSRNLMFREDGNLGVLDFQDAVIGPFTYDLVSLIKDCYISWPQSMIRDWALQYANKAQTAGIIDDFEEAQFLRSFDLMGVQRHLKATGIFSRLYLRDGKPGYLADIPRTLAYVKEVLGDYPDMYDLARWFEQHIYPLLWTRLKNIMNRAQP
jgi:aminoglycoside/choline kinase family phosphotransferase